MNLQIIHSSPSQQTKKEKIGPHQSSNQAINHQRHQQTNMTSYRFDFFQRLRFDAFLRFARAALVQLLFIVPRHNRKKKKTL